MYHIPDPESVIPFITRSPHRPSTAIKTSRLQSNPQEQKNPLSDLDSTSSSTLYPKLKLKKTSISSSLSSLINKELQKPQKATTSRYNLRSSRNIEQEEQSTSSSSRQRYHLRSTRHNSKESSPILSLGSSLSFLERQQAQPRSSTSSEINLSLPSRQQSLSLLTSGFNTSSALSDDVTSITTSADNFSEILPPLRTSTAILEYNTQNHSRPPTPNLAEYPIIVNGQVIHHPRDDPRFLILAQDLITSNDNLSQHRKKRELNRLNEDSITIKFEVEATFQNLNPHPIAASVRIKYKTTPSPFHTIDLQFESDPDIPQLTRGYIIFINPYSGLKYRCTF